MKILQVDTEKRRLGTFGEKAAARFLKKNGYRIKHKNYCPQGHEIDIVAENKEYIIFVEVKTRTIGRENQREPRPSSSVTPEKQRSVISAAKHYLAFHPNDKKKRMDVIEVYANSINGKYTVAEIKHLTSAFNLNTAYGRGTR